MNESMENYRPEDPLPIERLHWGTKILECRIAGTSYHNIDIWRDSIVVGQYVSLVRDYDNAYDENAIAVSLSNPYEDNIEEFDFTNILGYIPRKDNVVLAALLDMGWQNAISAYISEVNSESNSEIIKISIYIKQMDRFIYEETQDKKKRFWVINLAAGTMGDLEDNLFSKGYALYRWSKFLSIDEHNLPSKGECVIVFNSEAEKSVLYLMKLIASGNECGVYIENKELLYTNDELILNVFTNVKGPVEIDSDVLYFLEQEAADLDSLPKLLSRKASRQIAKLLDIDEYR